MTSWVIPTLGRLEALRNSSEESKIIEYPIDNFVPVVALTKQRVVPSEVSSASEDTSGRIRRKQRKPCWNF